MPVPREGQPGTALLRGKLQIHVSKKVKIKAVSPLKHRFFEEERLKTQALIAFNAMSHKWQTDYGIQCIYQLKHPCRATALLPTNGGDNFRQLGFCLPCLRCLLVVQGYGLNWNMYKLPTSVQSLDRRIKSLSLPDSQWTFYPVVNDHPAPQSSSQRDSNTLDVLTTANSWNSSKPTARNAGPIDGHLSKSRSLDDIRRSTATALRPDSGEEDLFNVENNPFAFCSGQLGKLINPKSLAAFLALGGPLGLERGLQSNRRAGLGTDERRITESVTFEQATSTPPTHCRLEYDQQCGVQLPLSPTSGPGGGFADRKRVFGENRLPERKSKSFLQLAWVALQDRVLILLSIAAVVSLALGLYQTFGQTHHEGAKVDWVEGVAIIVAIAIVVIVGALNDWQKERQFQKLNTKKEDRLVKVIRSGSPTTMSVYDVVVGDLMLLEAGDVVPVDGVFIDGHSLSCDESSATGESDLVKKTPADDVLHALLHREAPELKRLDPFIVSGARVLDGVGSFLVTAVGQNSSHGRTMMSLREDPGLTPLQSKLNILAGYIAELGSGAGCLLFSVLLIKFLAGLPRNDEPPEEKGQNFLQILITSITIIVVAVPEGLPLAVTLSLAFATKRMTRENNLVRHLQSCETMGNATVICSDKTGTLTGNAMTVVSGALGDGAGLLFGDENLRLVSDGGARILREIRPEQKEPLNASPTTVEKRQLTRIPMDELSSKLDTTLKDLLKTAVAVNTTAFEGDGAGGIVFTDDTSAGPGDVVLADVLQDMTWIGVVGIRDPVRPGVPAAVEDCRTASVSVKMVTGDNIETARAVGRECGILTTLAGEDGLVMEGQDFRRLSDEKKAAISKNLCVLARSSPEDKRMLVKILRDLGEIVAVTGDGTNDAPALKAADVGFSMGITGTEVAKEASDIILMDDNFASIVKALGWGRAINDSIKKFLQFQLTVNITAVVITFVTAVSDGKETSVLNAVQLLWVNLIMDTFAALALATDPPTGSILHRKPEPRTASLINLTMWKMIIGQSIYQLVVCFVLWFAGPNLLRYPEAQLRTLIFNVFVFMQIFKLINSRRIDNKLNIFEGLHHNWLFILMMTIMVGGQLIIIYVGGAAFVVVRLTGEQWAISVSLGFGSIPVGILIRLFPDTLLFRGGENIEKKWPRWLRLPAKRKGDDGRLSPGPSFARYNAVFSDIGDDLEFLRKVRGGRIRALSEALAKSHEPKPSHGHREMSRCSSRTDDRRRSSPPPIRPVNTPMLSAVGMPGIVAASVGGLSPTDAHQSTGWRRDDT
ncbi:hypothetical protein HIM_11366 [Hirsutella minnesotensis 3608]|uniref:Calcium-transporting ATPase n=1 Tax=Hirsutella minnesotensis 3608 TaxID=1043627 RepID=A0A0F7ZR99_9HYPO|nr:hypothetical protein HIM_11366 [Hirsutella minnesotensis 3608]